MNEETCTSATGRLFARARAIEKFLRGAVIPLVPLPALFARFDLLRSVFTSYLKKERDRVGGDIYDVLRAH